MTPREALLQAAEEACEQSYRAGLRQGLSVAERIVGWLNRVPDTPRQRETREWAEAAIRRAREERDL